MAAVNSEILQCPNCLDKSNSQLLKDISILKVLIDSLKAWMRLVPRESTDDDNPTKLQKIQFWLKHIPLDWREEKETDMEVGEPPAIMEDPPQPKEARKETQMPVGEPPSIMEDPKLQKEARKDKQIPLAEPYLTMEEPPQPKKIPEAPVVFVKQEVNVEPMKEHIVIDPLAINPETVELKEDDRCLLIKEEFTDKTSNPATDFNSFNDDLDMSQMDFSTSPSEDPFREPAKQSKRTVKVIKRGRCSDTCAACNTDACLVCKACKKSRKCELRVCQNLITMVAAAQKNCPGCGKLQANLARHMKVHCPATREASNAANSKGGAYTIVYICTEDSQRCHTKEEMDTHMDQHVGAANTAFTTRFACGVMWCSFEGDTRKEMVLHTRKDHPERVLNRKKKVRNKVLV